MKHSNLHRASGLGRLAGKMLIGGAAVAFLGLSINVQAQSCTVGNWTDAVDLTDDDTGLQGSNNRRYGGPCGLRVPFDGQPRLVMHESGQSETSYIARFYAFLDDVGSGDVAIFAAEDGADDIIRVIYNQADDELILSVRDASDEFHELIVSGVGGGWHSIEFEWHQDAPAEIAFLVNSDDPADEVNMTIDTSGLEVTGAMLGNVAGIDTGGFADFDDFDSRRSTRPGRLLRADANDDGSLTASDVLTVRLEVLGGSLAAGQPDCNEDGSVTASDILCTRLRVLSQ